MKRTLTCSLILGGALCIVHCGGDDESSPSGSKGGGGGKGGSGVGGVSGSGTGGASGTGTGGASGSGTGGVSTGGASGSGTGGASGSGTGGSGGSSGGTLTDAGNNDPNCPRTEPAAGSSCADAGVGGPGVDCRYTSGALCNCPGGGGAREWECFRFDGGGVGGGGNPFDAAGFDAAAFCPGMQPNNNANCGPIVGRTCSYGGTTCTCQPRDSGQGNGWNCQ
jgi:hypothetical protein